MSGLNSTKKPFLCSVQAEKTPEEFRLKVHELWSYEHRDVGII